MEKDVRFIINILTVFVDKGLGHISVSEAIAVLESLLQ